MWWGNSTILSVTCSEQKTKPTQTTVKELRSTGTPLEEETKRKIALFCDVEEDHVLGVPDVSNIYHVPLVLRDQHAGESILKILKLEGSEEHLERWEVGDVACDEA